MGVASAETMLTACGWVTTLRQLLKMNAMNGNAKYAKRGGSE